MSDNKLSIAFLVAVSAACAYADNVTMTTCASDTGPWSCLLEEWTTGEGGAGGAGGAGGGRQARILAPPNAAYYITERVDLVPPPPGPRPYDEWQGTPPLPPGPGKIVNRPPQHKEKPFKPSVPYPTQQYPPQKYPPPGARPPGPAGAADRVDPAPPRREVSETDLYLLGAIEKLVYRVDLMEKRMRKMEESVHYLVAGKDKAPEPCVENFTRVGSSCYHFSPEAYDWKTANLACRKLRSDLLEMDSKEERRQLMAAIHADKRIKELDFWTGGLNPGLLWIWSGSARPVAGNSSDVTVVGEGRCLALVYDPAAKGHVYRGQDCAFRHRYVCEKTEDKQKLSNEIERISRTLKLVEGGVRKSKLLWSDAQ